MVLILSKEFRTRGESWRATRHDARIVAERVTDEVREVKVHYNGWNKSHDQWIQADSDRLKGEDEELGSG